MIYKLAKDSISGQVVSVIRTDDDGKIWGIPFDEANTDYQQFKKDLANGAEFTDKDGYSLNFGMAGDFDLYNPIPAENT